MGRYRHSSWISGKLDADHKEHPSTEWKVLELERRNPDSRHSLRRTRGSNRCKYPCKADKKRNLESGAKRNFNCLCLHRAAAPCFTIEAFWRGRRGILKGTSQRKIHT